MKATLSCPQNKQVPIELINSKYNLNDIIEIDNGFYTLKENNIRIARNDILLVNDYITKAKEVLPCFPDQRIEANSLYFEEDQHFGGNYTRMSFSPATPTGKAPKFPVIVYFKPRQLFFGKIEYEQSTQIGRIELTTWEDSSVGYRLIVTRSGSDLVINQILKFSAFDGIKTTVYKR